MQLLDNTGIQETSVSCGYYYYHHVIIITLWLENVTQCHATVALEQPEAREQQIRPSAGGWLLEPGARGR